MSKIVMVGSGIVGAATGKHFASLGHAVTFSDISAETLQRLSSQGYSTRSSLELGKQDADAYIFAISTPTIDGQIKLDYLMEAMTHFAKDTLSKQDTYCIVVVRSTVIPGTVDEKVTPLLEQLSGKKVGKDFGVCMNPEFLREVSSEKDVAHPWIIVAGANDERSHALLKDIYGRVDCPYIQLAVKEAEMEKYLHNIFDACKISFFNEMRRVCDFVGLGADRLFNVVKVSSQAFWDPNYGLKDMGAWGGSCFPKDTQAFLHWTHDELKLPMPVLMGEIEENEEMKKRPASHS